MAVKDTLHEKAVSDSAYTTQRDYRTKDVEVTAEAGQHEAFSDGHRRMRRLARPEGFEPPTVGSEVRCSVQLS